MGLIYHAALENSLIMYFMDSRLFIVLLWFPTNGPWMKISHWLNLVHEMETFMLNLYMIFFQIHFYKIKNVNK